MRHSKLKKSLVIIVLGPQGSGKGTQTELLAKKFNLEYIGSGDLLRARKKKKDFTGLKISRVMTAGGRVATPVIFKIWMDKLEEFKKKSKLNGFIIDGSPRTILEAEMLEQALDWYEYGKDKKIIFINISPKESIWRLTKRRICKRCGQNIPFIGEFRKLLKCNKCKGDLFNRADDTIEGIKKRLEWFETEVRPTINYYKKRGELIKINGEQPIEKIFKDILEKIKL